MNDYTYRLYVSRQPIAGGNWEQVLELVCDTGSMEPRMGPDHPHLIPNPNPGPGPNPHVTRFKNTLKDLIWTIGEAEDAAEEPGPNQPLDR